MEEIYISSRTNPTVTMLCSLKTKKGREKESLYLCEGKKLCREALGRCKIRYAIIKVSRDNGELRNIATASGGDIILLSDGAFDKISTDDTPDGIAFAVEITECDRIILPNERVFALDCVRDPGNVGTIVRSAASFGIDRLILCDCADLFNPKTVRASMGAVFKIKFTVCGKLSEVSSVLKSQNRRIISTALTGNSVTLGQFSMKATDCLVVGNEGHGVSGETLKLSDETLIIPMTDKTESLNAAIASSVVMWEIYKDNM